MLALLLYNDVRTAPFHPAIHNLGNVGIGGRVHAQVAQAATRLIDARAYGGVHMRRELATTMAARYPRGTSLLEVGCGVGTLTSELERTGTFSITAADTSREMLAVARKRLRASTLAHANGVDCTAPVDVSAICMVMHELPAAAHTALLRVLCACTRKDVWIVDIAPTYTPSPAMLSGEPYLTDYLAHFETALARESDRRVDTWALVPGHVTVWTLTR